jgi:threonine aldolase
MQKFVSDYMEGAHPNILKRLAETNMDKYEGYGNDDISQSAKTRLQKITGKKNAEIYFLVGGTQTNETVISTMLMPYQGVISVKTGHINTHEAGAIEHGGHKVLTIDGIDGKISASKIDEYVSLFYGDSNHTHEVFPGMVYISFPTEYGTIYSRSELLDIRKICDKYDMKLFIDGARLGYGLTCDNCDVNISDIADVADVFYIGGTKVGALFGEAVVFPRPETVKHFYTMTKTHGAMLAKGWLLGIQFDELFKDDLYFKISKNANECAARIRNALLEKGRALYIDSPTNQIFPIVTPHEAELLSKKVDYGFMETLPYGNIVIRFCTSWATKADDVDELLKIIHETL